MSSIEMHPPGWRVRYVPFIGLTEVNYKEVVHLKSGYYGYASKNVPVHEMMARILEKVNRDYRGAEQ